MTAESVRTLAGFSKAFIVFLLDLEGVRQQEAPPPEAMKT
jgi:hypothetical protein